MRRIFLESTDDIVDLDEVSNETPIFAKRDGKLRGMVIKVPKHVDNIGWMLRLGGLQVANGLNGTRRECLESCSESGYDFFIEDTG